MSIGNKIKELRKKSSLTQEQLATRLMVSPQSISKWENNIAMPDITLLPQIASEFGVSIDELFDLTIDVKLRKIESMIDLEEEITIEKFKEYEKILLDELLNKNNEYKAISLLAHLYHHRMQTDAKKVKKYAEKAIMMHPEKKDCQWLLNISAGQRIWDWNIANHSSIIDFYKEIIENDSVTPQASLPYYYLIDNLLADNRIEESKQYLNKLAMLPSVNQALIPIYNAYIALAEYNENKAETIIEEGLDKFANSGCYLFEVAQFYANKAEYQKALIYYEKSWKEEENNKPRYTDALEGILTIYRILGNNNKIIETYDRIIACLKKEWNYEDDDLRIIDLENKKRKY